MKIINSNSNIFKSIHLLTGTKEASEWLKSIQDELANLLIKLGIDLDPNNSSQIGDAITDLVGAGGIDPTPVPSPIFISHATGIDPYDSASVWMTINWVLDPVPDNFQSFLLRWKLASDEDWLTAITTDVSYKLANLRPGGEYLFQISSVNRAGIYSDWSPDPALSIFAALDTAPPDPPTGLKVTGSYSTIMLEWDTNDESDMDKYEVYYSTSADFIPDTVDFTNRKSAPDITILSIPISRAYNTHYVKVCAMDKSGNRSGFTSGQIDLTDADPLTPNGIGNGNLTTGIKVDNQGKGSAWIKIDWVDGIHRGSEFGYYEYSVRNSIDDNALTISGTKESVYTFTPVLVGADYYIKVRAVSDLGAISAWSGEAHIVAAIDSVAPNPPTNIKATGGVDIIFLSWTKPVDIDLDHFEVYRNTSESLIGATRIAAYVTGEFWFDSSITSGVNYTYWIKSVDWSKNESVYSDSVTTITANVLNNFIAPSIPTNIKLTTGIEYGYSGTAFTWIKAAWNKNPEEDINYYEFRIKSSGGAYRTAKVTNPFEVIRNVLPGTEYSISVRAVDFNLNASAYSYPDITITSASDETIPNPPTALSAIPVLKNIVLSWINPRDNTSGSVIQDFKCIEIWRSNTNDRTTATLIGTTRGETYIDTVGTYDITKYYWLRSKDWSDNPSNTGNFLLDDNWFPLSKTAGIGCVTTSLMAEDVTGLPKGYDMSVNADFVNNLSGWLVGSKGILPTIVDTVNGKSGNKVARSPMGQSASIVTEKQIPIDTDRSYIVELYSRIAPLASPGKLLFIVRLFNDSGVEIFGDTASCWYKVYEGNPTDIFTYQSGTFGPNTKKVFPAGARFIKLECVMDSIDNYGALEVQGIRLREIIEGAYIGDAAISSAHIGEEQVLSSHILDLTADKISAGLIQSVDKKTKLNLTDGTFSLKDTFVWDGLKLNIDGDVEIGANPNLGVPNYLGNVAGISAAGISNWADASTGTVEIKGGFLKADSVSANSLNIGSRTCTLDGLAFQVDKVTNIVTWTTGKVSYISDDNAIVSADISQGLSICDTRGIGTTVVITGTGIWGTHNTVWTDGTISYLDTDGSLLTYNIPAGSTTYNSTIKYLYYVKGNSNFSITTSLPTAQAEGNIYLARLSSSGTSKQTSTPGTIWYFYWVKGSTTISSTTDRTVAMAASNLPLGSYAGDIKYLNINYGKTIIDGSEITTGTVKADRIVANSITADQLSSSNLITLAAQIGDAIITTAHVSGLDIGDAKISGNLEATRMSLNAGSAINSGSTQIDPGMILVSGETSLADWRHGTDNTKIDGGNIYANSITANKLTIGNRGLTITGLEISSNYPTINTLYWTAGTVVYINDSGTLTTCAVSGGSQLWSSGTLYLYWTQEGSGLLVDTVASTAGAANNVIFATYKGATDLVANYGRTIIDGSKIITGTIVASSLKTDTITSDSACIGSLNADKITAGTLAAARISAGTISTDKLEIGTVTCVNETWQGATPLDAWSSVLGSGEMTIITNSDGIIGSNFLRIGNNSGNDHRWLIGKANIPYDPLRLYRIRTKLRMTAGVGTAYIGWAGIGADGVSYVNTSGINVYSNQHYHCAAGVTPASSWTDYEGYTKGFGAVVGTSQAGTLQQPASMHPNVRFIRPVIVVNYNSLPGITEIDSLVVEWMPIALSPEWFIDGTFGKTLTVGTNGSNLAGISGAGTGIGTDVRFWAGDTLANNTTAPFRVTQDGSLTASKGKIAGWTIGANELYNLKETIDSTTSGIYIGTSGISLGNGGTSKFKVASDGSLTATKATITGDISSGSTITCGTKFSVTSDGTLTCTNADISGKITMGEGSSISWAAITDPPTIPTIPSSLPASDVYSWAKASTKPAYSASEVGALPDSTVLITADAVTSITQNAITTATISANQINGNGLTVKNGSFAGSLVAATGTFTGQLVGATGSFSGSLSAGTVDMTKLVGQATTYSTPGTYTTTVPTSLNTVRITLCGGGGGGGATVAGGGGGSGGWVQNYVVGGLADGATVSIVVGAGGVAVSSGAGGNGGTSSVTIGGTLLARGYGGTGGGAGGGATYGSADSSGQFYTSTGAAGGSGTSGNGSYGTDSLYLRHYSYDHISGYNADNGSAIWQHDGDGYFQWGGDGGSSLWGACGTGAWYNWGYAATAARAATSPTGYGAGGGGGQANVSISTAGYKGFVTVEFYNPNGVVLRTDFNTLTSALLRQGIAIV